MIIFYNKKNGNIIGTLDGRVHTDEQMNNVLIIPEGISKKDIGKYLVPLEPKTEEITEDIFEIRVSKKTRKAKKVKVGIKKTEKIVELLPSGYIYQEVRDYENRKININDYKLNFDSNGEVIGIELKK